MPGLVTNERGIALMTLYADCVPVLFYEPVQRVIAVCHCGWKGTVQKIAANMAQVAAGFALVGPMAEKGLTFLKGTQAAHINMVFL